MKLIIGCHVSFNSKDGLLGSAKEAKKYGANTFMFYTGAPQNTVRCPLDEKTNIQGKQFMKKNNIDIKNVIIHAPYIINLANDKDKRKHNFMINFLKQEIDRAKQLGINKIVLHPGSHVGLGIEKAILNIIDSLNNILEGKGPIICLETMAGKGTEIGTTFEQINQIIKGIKNKKRIMVCLDTCHINDAGYNLNDFDNILEEFDNIIGLDKLGCVHINDSKNSIGSHKDRHENIGTGTIGFDNLLQVIYHPKLKDIPKILETPYVSKNGGNDRTYPPYKFELEMIRHKKLNPNLLEDIRNNYDISDSTHQKD